MVLLIAKGVFAMATSNLPLRVPERQPETSSPARARWPRPVKKPSRFVIKVGGVVPC